MSAVDLDALIAELRTPIRVQYEEKPNHVLRRANVSRLNAAKALEDLRRAPVSAGKVKALVWKASPDPFCHDHWEASACGGAYHMAPDEDSASGEWILQWTLRRKAFCMSYGGSISDHPGPDAAKAAAQADYEARILSALQPGDGWRGIESAPKDVEFLACCAVPYDLCHAVVVDGAIYAVSDGGVFNGATHWMPLPAPPASVPQGEETR